VRFEESVEHIQTECGRDKSTEDDRSIAQSAGRSMEPRPRVVEWCEDIWKKVMENAGKIEALVAGGCPDRMNWRVWRLS
jgi:hypothetical protein